MSEDDEDPFENLDVPEDREGDPFERLGDVGPAAEGDDDDTDDDTDDDDTADEGADGTAEADTDPTEMPPASGAGTGMDTDPADEPPESTASAGPADGEDEPAFEEEFIDADDPFATGPGTTPGDGQAAGSAPGQPDDDPLGGDDPFTGMESREGDPFGEGESIFESVDVESVDADEVWESLDEEPTTTPVEGSRYVEVSKHRFCEQCEHFASPPDAHCTNDEAEIIEFLDMETVRLLNCPVVAEQRELENEE